MLKSIKINRFKSIRDQTVDLGTVNIFVGGNGAGKSNILEAIGITSAALERGVTEQDLSRKGVRLSTPKMFKSSFKNQQLPRTLRIETAFTQDSSYSFELSSGEADTQFKFFTESAIYKGVKLIGRGPNGAAVNGRSIKRRIDERRSLWDQTRTSEDYPDEFLHELQELGRYVIYSPQTEFLRGTEVGTVATPPIGLHGEGLPQAVQSLILHWDGSRQPLRGLYDDIFSLVWLPGWASLFRVGPVDPQIMSSEVKTGERTLFFVDRFMKTSRNTLTAYDSSEGTLFLVFLAVLLGHPDVPKIFSIDNVDSALNPGMTRRVVAKIIECATKREFKDNNVGPNQIFLTSHNPTALDAFDIFDEECRIFIVKRNEDGHTQIKRLSPPKGISREIWIEKSGGRTLSELWIEGKIPGALGADRL